MNLVGDKITCNVERIIYVIFLHNSVNKGTKLHLKHTLLIEVLEFIVGRKY